ncbi:MAG: PAS domain S-box protein, partial [Chloroflexota bacterium]
QITGYGPEEFSAKIWDTLIEEFNLVDNLAGYSLDEGIQRVRSGEEAIWKCEHRIRARDGKIHWVFEAAVELRDKQGVAYGSIGTYQDITERKQAESKLKEQLDELQRWNAATLGRETRVLELKHEVNELLTQTSQPPRYPSAELGKPMERRL